MYVFKYCGHIGFTHFSECNCLKEHVSLGFKYDILGDFQYMYVCVCF